MLVEPGLRELSRCRRPPICSTVVLTRSTFPCYAPLLRGEVWRHASEPSKLATNCHLDRCGVEPGQKRISSNGVKSTHESCASHEIGQGIIQAAGAGLWTQYRANPGRS